MLQFWLLFDAHLFLGSCRIRTDFGLSNFVRATANTLPLGPFISFSFSFSPSLSPSQVDYFEGRKNGTKERAKKIGREQKKSNRCTLVFLLPARRVSLVFLFYLLTKSFDLVTAWSCVFFF